MSGHTRRVVAVACTVIAVVASLTLLPVTNAGAQGGDWLSRINGLRSSHGLAPLAVDGQLTGLAQGQAQRNASSGVLAHTGNLAAGVSSAWTKLGENVGFGHNPDQLWNGFLNSAPHRANLLDPAFTHVGIGVVFAGDGTQWVVHRFMATSGGGGGGGGTFYEPPPQPAPTPRRSAPPTTRAPAPPPPVVDEAPPTPPPPPLPKAEPARVAAVLDALRAAG